MGNRRENSSVSGNIFAKYCNQDLYMLKCRQAKSDKKSIRTKNESLNSVPAQFRDSSFFLRWQGTLVKIVFNKV